MSRIRVVHIVSNLNYGGLERVVGDILRRADTARFDCHLLALGYLGHLAEGLEQQATLHLADAMSFASMARPVALSRQLRELAPQVVHSHSGVWYKSSLAVQRSQIPFSVHTDHGRMNPDPWQDRWLDRIASRRTDVTVAVSEVLREQMARTVVADPSRLRVIPNGIDTYLYAPRPDDGLLRGRLGLGADVPILGSIGRLEPIKAYDIMIEAVGILRREWTAGPAPVLVLGGDGSERVRLERLAAERGLTDAVHFLGWRDDISSMHTAFTLFTMSSRSEGTSISLLEAMSAGLCPVVTEVGGNPAVLGEELRHLLAPPNDPPALARTYRAALTDADRRRRDAETARQRVLERFGVDAMVRAYEDLYQSGATHALGSAA